MWKRSIWRARKCDWRRNEIMNGSRCGRFEPALDLLRARRVNVLDMISTTMPLSRARRAFQKAAQRGVLKVLLNAD